MFSGDAPRCTATMSVIRDRTRSKSKDMFAYFSDPYGFLRTVGLSLADIGSERWAAIRQRRRGDPHVKRSGLYPLIRATITVVSPDILVNSMYDPVANEVAPFEEFMGSHGGLGGPQTRPFAVVPCEWTNPAGPIVGVEAMHGEPRDWIAQSRSAGGDRDEVG